MKIDIKKLEIKRKIFPVLIWTIVFLWCLVFLTLLLWSMLTSLKTVFDFYQNPVWIPKKENGGWMLENYSTAMQAINITIRGIRYGIPTMLKNSLLFAVGNGFFSVLTACLASYILAKYKYIPWVNGLWAIVMITSYLPIGSSTAANITYLHNLNMHNSMIGYWIWSSGTFAGIFLIYYAAWKSVSWNYAEAAFIDGAGHFRTMAQVMWPMTRTIFGVLFLTQFIGLWNDYMSPIYYLPSYPTMSYGAWLFQFNVENPDVAVAPIQLAGLLTLAFPIFILFMLFRNKLMGSLTIGGLKG